MNLSDKPCYPLHIFDKKVNESVVIQAGLTFRERLIIALASNPALVCLGRGAEEGLLDYNLTVLRISQLANKIIKELENEKH